MRKAVSFRRLAGGIAVFLLMGIAIAAVRWQATLNALGDFLIDSNPPQQADLVLVLGGDFWGPRVITGAELVRHHFAPFALISGPLYRDRPEGEWAIDFLVKQGYPRNFFQVFATTGAGSTIAEAQDLRRELSRRHVQRVLLVTSNYHSRRAEIVLTLFCPGIKFISVPADDPHYHARDWWMDPSSKHYFYLEWGKIAGSVAVYPAYLVLRLFGRDLKLPDYRPAAARISTLRMSASHSAFETASPGCGRRMVGCRVANSGRDASEISRIRRRGCRAVRTAISRCAPRNVGLITRTSIGRFRVLASDSA